MRPELEGLAKKVWQPHVTTFRECFEDSRRWNHNGGNHQLLINHVGELKVSPFCAVTGKRAYQPMSVIPADWVYSRIREGTINIDDTMAFEVIDHGNGWALVIANHNKICGDVWLAYILSDSIPKEEGY